MLRDRCRWQLATGSSWLVELDNATGADHIVVGLSMTTRVLDQSESERRLHRALYILKYLRANTIHMVLMLFGIVLFVISGVGGFGIYSFEKAYSFASGEINIL
jgi:hypothetical protein